MLNASVLLSRGTFTSRPDVCQKIVYVLNWLLFQGKGNTEKLLNCLSSGDYNLKSIKSSCNLKTDLNRAKVGHFLI